MDCFVASLLAMTREKFVMGRAPAIRSRLGIRLRQFLEMTRHPLTLRGQPQLRLLRPAAIEHEGTAGIEAASAGRIDRARHIAFQDHRVARGAGRTCDADALALAP